MRKVNYQPAGRSRGRPCRRQGACRPMDDGFWRLLGCGFIGVGLLLLFLCIPGWAWTALAGIALVCAGWALISTCGR